MACVLSLTEHFLLTNGRICQKSDKDSESLEKPIDGQLFIILDSFSWYCPSAAFSWASVNPNSFISNPLLA